MTDNSIRRKLLKSILAGSGAVIADKSLPDKWTRPVVSAVVLPAHAQTTRPNQPSQSCPEATASAINAETLSPNLPNHGIGIWDAGGVKLGSVCACGAAGDPELAAVTVNNLSAGVYIVSMGMDLQRPVSTTLKVSTECSSIIVSQDILEGSPDGSGTAMVKITLPEGLLEEIHISPYDPINGINPII